MVTGPVSEQVEEGRVLHLCHCDEPTEFPGILHKGEVPLEESEEAGGELHRRRGPGKNRKQKTSQNGKTKTSEVAPPYILLFGSSVLSRSTQESRETRRRGASFNTLLNNVGDTTNDD